MPTFPPGNEWLMPTIEHVQYLFSCGDLEFDYGTDIGHGIGNELGLKLKKAVDQSKWSDCTVKCKDKVFHAHKVVLASCSEYFSQVLENTSISTTNELFFNDVDPLAFEAMIESMYLSYYSTLTTRFEDSVSPAFHLQVWKIANDFACPELQKMARARFLGELADQEPYYRLLAGHILKMIKMVWSAAFPKHGSDWFKRAICRLVASRAKELLKHKVFLNLVGKVPGFWRDYSLTLTFDVLRGELPDVWAPSCGKDSCGMYGEDSGEDSDPARSSLGCQRCETLLTTTDEENLGALWKEPDEFKMDEKK